MESAHPKSGEISKTLLRIWYIEKIIPSCKEHYIKTNPTMTSKKRKKATASRKTN